jgi:hypothetical protein
MHHAVAFESLPLCGLRSYTQIDLGYVMAVTSSVDKAMVSQLDLSRHAASPTLMSFQGAINSTMVDGDHVYSGVV